MTNGNVVVTGTENETKKFYAKLKEIYNTVSLMQNTIVKFVMTLSNSFKVTACLLLAGVADRSNVLFSLRL
jgi:hypothetical protein